MVSHRAPLLRAGKSIGDLGVRQASGATIIATVDKTVNKSIPDLTLLLRRTRLVVVGERQQQRLFKQILMNGRG